MKNNLFVSICALILISACQPAAEPAADMEKVKAEIQNLENAWADAMNARDVDALMAMYADDAVAMSDGEPSLSGKEAIRKKTEKDFEKADTGQHFNFQTLDVVGTGDVVTETGKTTVKDDSGKEISTGKYMAVWQKRDGKYLCTHDISNTDKVRAPAGYKTLHLFDFPNGMTESDLSSGLQRFNTAIEELGYPGSGYFLYKYTEADVKDYRYYFEGVWPDMDTYNTIHESPEWQAVAGDNAAVYEQLKPVEIYRKMALVK